MLYSYRQMRRDYKIKFTDKSKANLWIYLDLAKVHRLKGLTSPYIISYLHFLNLNNILTLPQVLVVAEPGFGLARLMFALFFACQIYTHAHQFTKSKQMQAVYKLFPIENRPNFWFLGGPRSKIEEIPVFVDLSFLWW